MKNFAAYCRGLRLYILPLCFIHNPKTILKLYDPIMIHFICRISKINTAFNTIC